MPTLDEIIQNPKMVVHTTRKEQAHRLLRKLSDKGLTWSTGESYMIHSRWDEYKSNTCYLPYSGEFASYDWFEENPDYTIISYYDIQDLYDDDIDYEEALNILLDGNASLREKAEHKIRQAIEKAWMYDELDK